MAKGSFGADDTSRNNRKNIKAIQNILSYFGKLDASSNNKKITFTF